MPTPFPVELTSVIDYLLWARDAEEDPWFRDDYQITIRTCLNVGKGVLEPFVVACCETLGLHPEQVWASISARRRVQMGRLFREGLDDVTFHPHPELVAAWEARQVRKKPCRRVEFLPRKVA